MEIFLSLSFSLPQCCADNSSHMFQQCQACGEEQSFKTNSHKYYCSILLFLSYLQMMICVDFSYVANIIYICFYWWYDLSAVLLAALWDCTYTQWCKSGWRMICSRVFLSLYYWTVIAPGNREKRRPNREKTPSIYSATPVCWYNSCNLCKSSHFQTYVSKWMHLWVCMWTQSKEKWRFELSATPEGSRLCDNQEQHAENKRLIGGSRLKLSGCSLDLLDSRQTPVQVQVLQHTYEKENAKRNQLWLQPCLTNKEYLQPLDSQH